MAKASASIRQHLKQRLDAARAADQQKFLKALATDLTWLQRVPQDSDEKVVDLALLAFAAAEAQPPRWPQHVPQSKVGLQEIVEIAKQQAAIPPGVGITAAMGKEFVRALRDDSTLRDLWPDLSVGVGFDVLCGYLDRATAWLDTLAEQGASVWNEIDLPPFQQVSGGPDRKRYFIRMLSKLFEKIFRAPHDDLVAKLTNKAYPASPDGGVSAEAVKKLRQRRDKTTKKIAPASPR